MNIYIAYYFKNVMNSIYILLDLSQYRLDISLL